jgi:sporulation protein YlmC with PRC-barrel domain
VGDLRNKRSSVADRIEVAFVDFRQRCAAEGKTMNVEPGILVRLRDSGQTLADPGQDVRGRTVRDCDGNELGAVGDLLIDPVQRKVRLLQVEHGGLFGVGTAPLYIPAETVERVTIHDVHVERTRVSDADCSRYRTRRRAG